MPIKRVIAVGCSWTYGDELLDPNLDVDFWHRDNDPYRLANSYPGLVAAHYGLELENCGFPGASLESMRWVLHWHIKNTPDLDNILWLVGLTDSTRKSWYNPVRTRRYMHDPLWNKHIHGVWLNSNPDNPDIDPSWMQLQKLWTVNSYHREWAEHNHWETVTAFSSLGKNAVQFNCLVNPYKHANVINDDSSFKQLLTPKHCEAGGHPSVSGHEIISKHLINHIDCANIIA